MSEARRFSLNISVHFLGSILNTIITFIFTVFLARTIGVGDFGKFSLVQIIVSSCMTIADLGLTNVAVRSLAREQHARPRVFSSILMLRALLALLTVVIVIPVSYFLVEQTDTRRLVLIYALAIIPFGLISTCLSAFNGSERMGYAIIPVLWNIATTLASIMAVGMGRGLDDVFTLFVVGNILSAVTALYAVHRYFFPIRLFVVDFQQWRQFLAAAIPFGLMIMMGMLGVSIGPILLSKIAGEASVGYYSVASKINSIFMIGIGAYNTAIYPTLVRLQQTSQPTFYKVYRVTIKLLMVVALPATLGLTLLAGDVIGIAFPGYGPATRVFQTLLWFSFFSLLSTICLNMLYAEDRQRDAARVMLLATVACIVLSYILIPFIGIVGAGIAQIGLTAAQYLLSSRIVARRYPINLAGMFYQSLPGLGFVLLAGLLTSTQNIFLRGCTMLVAFYVSTRLFHPFDGEEQDLLRRLPFISRLATMKSWISNKLIQIIEPRGL